MKNYKLRKPIFYRITVTLYFFWVVIFGVSANEIPITNESLSKKERMNHYGILTFVSSTPTTGANGISRSANIVLNFNEAVDGATVNTTNIKVNGSQTGIIAASFSGGGTTQITIDPTTDFKPGELITVTLLTGLQSLATNEALSSARTIQFTVGTAAIDYYSLPTTPIKTTIATGTDADGLKSLYTVDLDGDGDMDILGASDPGDKLMWYENDGSQNFTANVIASGATVDALHSVFATDLDNDGDIDIITSGKSSSTKINYYLNNGSEVFTKFDFKNEIIGASSKTVYVADMDNDGDKDMVYLSVASNGYVAIAENDGSLSFSNSTVDSSMASPWGMYVEDIDSDGDLDIIVGTVITGTNTDKISWYENDGSGSFTEQSITTTADSVRSVFVIDVDGDGDMDFLSTSVDNNSVSWWQNNGSEVFTKIDIDTGANGATDVTAADVDGDGDIDVLSANQTDTTIALYLNNGSEVFTKKIITNSLGGARFVHFSDLDSDGDLDIITAATSDDLSWFENKLTNSWTGTTNTDWDTTTNWSLGAVPTGTTDVLVPNVTNDPIASGAITVNELILNADASLTVNGTLTNNDIITINSGASFIAQTSVSGNIRYNRTLGTTNWYLISAPLVGQDVDDFVTANALPTGTGSNKALGSYNNATPGWDYYQDGTSNADVLTPGVGRSIKLSAAADISFTGTMNVTDIVSVELIDGAANEFNLIGNPYPSYIAVNDLADGTNNLFRANGTNGINGNDGNVVLAEDTIWLWDQSLNTGTGAYTQINLVSSKFIAPSQGFFVRRTTDGGTLNFNFRENMQSHQAVDGFSRTSNIRPEIKLKMSSASNSSSTEIYFIAGTTLGFDNGYDSTIFEGAANDFVVYTHLVSNSQGQNLGIQSVPDENFNATVFPIGVNAVSGTEITFSTESINIPNGLSVILEDRITGTYTVLDNSTDTYTVTLNQNSSGIGRFYLHVNSVSVLSTGDIFTESISMYTTSTRNVRITGLPKGRASLKMYSLLGQEVFTTSFIGTRVNDTQLPSTIKPGIYIVTLETELGSLQRKIILE